MATPIDSFVMTGATWDTFRKLFQLVNQCIARLNGIGTSSEISISGGEINGTPIGLSTPNAAQFTNLEVVGQTDLTASEVLFANDSISGDKISGGTIEVSKAVIADTPTLDTHATNKLYVDTSVDDLNNKMIAYTMIFGG